MSDKVSAMLDKVIAAANNPKNLNEAGEFVQAQAKLLAPADTGYLRNSIFLDVEKTTEGAEAKIYEFSSSSKDNSVIGKFMMVHNAKNTTAHGKFVYLSKDNSNITKDIISKINKGMDNSVSSEDIRGLILGEKSNINAKPILIIDCDDVHASHGCAIGTVDDNEVYYLMSRGLTKDEAMKIISKSLITPLLKASTSIDFNNVINPYLEKMIEA